ncbi:MAG TPA: hypothetical protein VI818_08455 [Candidatus Thermoplasmatota archaeon]|nr:hypothetical protein [Candidatus Thermoplasmatota archaeon]
MQKLVVLTLVTFVLSLAVPTATASPSFEDLQKELTDVGSIEVSVSSTSIAVSWQGIEIGPNASAMVRDMVDGMDGNEKDGNVSEEEADLAETVIKTFVQNEFDFYTHRENYQSGLLVIDAVNPKTAKVDALAAGGLIGPVMQEEGITLSFVTSILFPTKAADVHTVKLDMGRYYFHQVNESKASEMVDDFSLTVRGFDGWSIDAASIQPECGAEQYDEESGAMVFTAEHVNCFTGHSGVLLGFSITGGSDTAWDVPAPGAPIAIAILGLAGFLLRRRN